MLNSLQLLDKYRIIFLLLLCFDIVFLSNSYVSAFEFGVSPSELNFQGKEGEEICKNVKIFSSLDGINIAIEDKWTTQKDSSKNLNEYLMDSNELKINMNYERDFLLNNEREIKICLKSEIDGKFKVILFFQALDNSLNIGIWLNADISKTNQASKITGFSIKDLDGFNPINIFLPLTSFNLFLLLALLFVHYKRKKNRQD